MIPIEQKLNRLTELRPSKVPDLTSSAVLCMQKRHLDHLSNCLQKFKFEDCDTFEKNVSC